MKRKTPEIDDAALARAVRVLAELDMPSVNLPDEYRALVESYRALSRKLHKTLLISDRYQEQIQELNGNLFQKVEAETERRLAQERLLAQNAKMAAMGEMIDAIAHQWRQPLTTVDMVIQNIVDARRFGKLDDAYLEKLTDRATLQLRYMASTIDTFRGFFRHDKQAVRFSVSEKVVEAVSLVRPQMPGNLVLEATVPSGDDFVWGLPNEFEQVVVNLLANARDAVLERQRNASDGNIAVRVVSESEQIRVEVRDNGVGIPAESATRLFEPDFSTKKSREGSGLGLYMSRLIIVQSMGGEITFSSVPGNTVFVVVLPKAYQEDTLPVTGKVVSA